jgi:predicted SAM-dependent methyltransferase
VKTAVRTIVKQQSTRAMRDALRLFLNEWEISRLHHRELRKVSRFLRSRPLKVNLGCGPNPKDGWVNIDLFDAKADLRLDLREPWPFPDGSVSYIYSEHVFEHFELHHEVPRFLAEAVRILEPGGVFDVVVPDSEPPLKAYGNPDAPYWSASAKVWHPAWCHTELDHINYHFRQDGEHKYAWDAETLARTLRSASFNSIKQREFNPQLDTEARRFGSLYMIAKKP